MTSPGTDVASLGAVIARTRYLLLDFDGPICSIYAGLTDATVAAQLRKLIPGELPDEIASTPDPIEVFCYSATVSDELAARVEAEMADLEVAAVPTADPTPYVHQVIASARESRRIVGVVSNNGPRAVNAYLDRHGLSEGIRLVVARTSHDPALLKPSPHLINEAIRGLNADPAATTLAADHGISRATAYRYVDEAVDVLSAQAPGLDEALERALAEGAPYVVLDGKIFETDRLAETVTSAKGEDINAWYSGKKHRPGANVQAVMLPGGLPAWTSRAEPGHVHDITAARARALPALYRAAALTAGGVCLSVPVVMLIRSFITRS